MKLAYLVTQYPKVSHTFVRREIFELERRGHSVLRLAIRRPDDDVVDPIDRDEATRTIHCLERPPFELIVALASVALTRPFSFASGLWATLRMARAGRAGLLRHLAYLVEAAFLVRILEREGIEHLHAHFGTNSATVALLTHRLGGPRFSMTVHGPDEFDDPIGLALALKVADSAFTIAISHYTASQLMRWAALRDWSKIHVVACSVDEEFFDAAHPISPGCHTLVSVGRLTAQKAPLLLLEAFAQALGTGIEGNLVLAGDGELRGAVENRIDELGIADRVRITGWLSGAEVRKEIAGARCFVLPSFAEGLPVVIMEAFAQRRPVISTFVCGIPELVVPGENGWLVPAGDVDALAQAISDALAAASERLAAMGEAGARAVRERHSSKPVIDGLESLLLASCSSDEKVQ